MSEGKFLTVREMADEARVSNMTIYRLIHSGVLRKVRIGRSIRVPESDWREYLASGVKS